MGVTKGYMGLYRVIRRLFGFFKVLQGYMGVI